MSLGIVYWQKKKPTKPVKTNSWHWPNNVAPYCVLHQCSVTGMWDFSISIYFATEARFKGPKIGYGLGIRAGLQWMKINLSTWQFIRWPDIDIVCTIWTWISIIYFKCKAIVNRAIYHFKSWLCWWDIVVLSQYTTLSKRVSHLEMEVSFRTCCHGFSILK